MIDNDRHRHKIRGMEKDGWQPIERLDRSSSPDWMKRMRVPGMLIVVSAGVLGFGNFHVIHGALGFHVIERASFGFTDAIVNSDEIVGQPALVARIRHPLATQALERAGLITFDSPQGTAPK